MTVHPRMRVLSYLIGSSFAATSLFAQVAAAPSAGGTNAAEPTASAATSQPVAQRANPSSTSNTTTSNDTLRQQQMATVVVSGKTESRGGGLMTVQTAPTAVSTISREAIEKSAPGSNFTQLIQTIPGVDASTDDVTGLSNGNYSLRGYASSEIGVTVNGAPVSDSGSYAVYATEYGDAENYGDLTVLQGRPDLNQPNLGAAGGNIAWSTIDPTHDFNVYATQSFGSNDYRRTFLRVNTGDTGPVRSWLSYSTNQVDQWRGYGDLDVQKVDGKSIWTIDANNSISASFQYNHQLNYQYSYATKANVAQYGYDYNYVPFNPASTSNGSAWPLHGNPFDSYLVSLDGEFRLTDTLHLSVIPYVWHGDGGGSANSVTATEDTGTTNTYLHADQDLNGDGVVTNGKKASVYAFSQTTTWRPGIIAKLNQDFGLNDSLEYGVWYERPRQQQNENFSTVNQVTGNPNSFWSDSSNLYYPDGKEQYLFLQYTNTEVQKAFVTNTWSPNDQWSFVTGAAYLHANRSGYDYSKPDVAQQLFINVDSSFNKVLPTASIKFAPDDRNQFYISTGETYRIPTNVGVALNGLADVAVAPETAWTTDLGWRFYDNRWAVSADLYNSNFRNKQLSGYDATYGTVYTNIPKSTLQGFNGEVSYDLGSDFKTYLSYTYTKAVGSDNLYLGTGDGTYATAGKTLPNTPRNLVRATLQYSHGPIWAGLSEQYNGSRWGDFMNTEKAGGYATLNFNGGYKFDKLGVVNAPYIKLNVFNILDRHAFSNVAGLQGLASNPGGIYVDPITGKPDYASAPGYNLLQPRAFVVTFGGSF